MIFAFYTDMHWSGKGPARRKDNYPETVERKHRFIYRDGEARGAEFFAFGGDMNDYHTVASSTTNKQFAVMNEERSVPEYGIIGNHDVVGNNSERVDYVPVSHLYSSRYINRLSKDIPTRIVGKDGTVIALYGIDVHKDMDNLRPEDYYVEKPEWADFCILVAHGWLREKQIKIEGVRHTTFNDVIETDTQADVILTGHDHGGHGVVIKARLDGKPIVFFNPGSPVRVKAAEYEMERQVGYGMVQLEKDKPVIASFIAFPGTIALPSQEVLDRESLLEDIQHDIERGEIRSKYENFSIHAVKPRDVILEIAGEEQISEFAREDLIRRIDEEELALAKKSLTYSTE